MGLEDFVEEVVAAVDGQEYVALPISPICSFSFNIHLDGLKCQAACHMQLNPKISSQESRPLNHVQVIHVTSGEHATNLCISSAAEQVAADKTSHDAEENAVVDSSECYLYIYQSSQSISLQSPPWELPTFI